MRSAVWGRRKIVLGIAGLFSAGAALPQDAGQKNAKKDHNVAAGEKEAKKLLLLMDKDQNGKVSKQEFMSFMEAEFERLDVDKNGELDVQELTQSRVRSSGAIHR
jgi:hypothetical protein